MTRPHRQRRYGYRSSYRSALQLADGAVDVPEKEPVLAWCFGPAEAYPTFGERLMSQGISVVACESPLAAMEASRTGSSFVKRLALSGRVIRDKDWIRAERTVCIQARDEGSTLHALAIAWAARALDRTGDTDERLRAALRHKEQWVRSIASSAGLRAALRSATDARDEIGSGDQYGGLGLIADLEDMQRHRRRELPAGISSRAARKLARSTVVMALEEDPVSAARCSAARLVLTTALLVALHEDATPDTVSGAMEYERASLDRELEKRLRVDLGTK
jgi:hypothetical protein